MRGQYKHSIWGLTRIVAGISIGLAVGFLFTSILQLFINWINLDELL